MAEAQGTASETYVNITDAETYSLPIPSRTGYQFAGWFHNGSMVNSGDPVTITESATFTVQWEPNPYMVVFDANSPVAAPPAPLSCVY